MYEIVIKYTFHISGNRMSHMSKYIRNYCNTIAYNMEKIDLDPCLTLYTKIDLKETKDVV